MRCKPGQMAIRIKRANPLPPESASIPIGGIVTCIEVLDNNEYHWATANGETAPLQGIVWRVEYNGDTETYGLMDFRTMR